MTTRYSFVTGLECDRCRARFAPTDALNLCPACSGLLEYTYDLQGIAGELSPRVFAGRTKTIWRWHELLPLVEPRWIVSLGEGGTPLVPSVYAGPRLGLDRLYFKNDGVMPTGSFKDRGFSLAVSCARGLGVRHGLTYTSGNAGASFAAYAQRGGIDAVVLVEFTANRAKAAAIRLYGVPVGVLHFHGMEEITTMLETAVREIGLYQFVNFINPVRHEAMKSYAYEIAEELRWMAPDVMIHPVGTGGGIWGAWKGFRELETLGWVRGVPRMVAVQPQASGHIPEAFRRGARRAERYGDSNATIAQSISADAPIQGGERVLSAVYDSGGWADGVSDSEILEAMRWLGREGISAEPAAAAPLAALKRAVTQGLVDPDWTVVCVVTGSGLKQPAALSKAAARPRWHLNADFSELRTLLESAWSKD